MVYGNNSSISYGKISNGMVEVRIDNSESIIEGLSIEQFRALKKILSYMEDPKLQYMTRYRMYRKYLIDAKGRFPTGLLYLVQKYLKDTQIPHQVKDLRIAPRRPKKPLYHMNLQLTPYPQQIEASRACQVAKRGIITAVTGSGKSLIAALIINELQMRTLVVVPSLELKRQLTSNFISIFGSSKVGDLASKKPIVIENVDALPKKQPMKGYDCLIIDEFHHSGAATYRKLNKYCWNGIFYRFGLTATPFRSKNTEKLLLESTLSHIIYRLDYKTAVQHGYIVPIEAYYIELPKKPVKGQRWPEVYSEFIVNNEYRNKLTITLLQQLKGLSTLCLVKEILHGEHLSKAGFPFVNGQNDERDLIKAFNTGKIATLIGTTGIIGEGVDTKPCEYVIIAGLGKSKNQFMQQVGRGLRRYGNKTSCKVIIFKDTSHKWTLNHFKAQCKILEDEYGIVPAKIVVDVPPS